ncbi:MAG: bifunctional 4-hydroxy-2-oxoglutarate aldolase/2-dehydro-3-deoxy-phosphogluconate aldolase, partial [Actinomycetota bacterium]
MSVESARVIAVVRYRQATDLGRAVDVLSAGGILVEITLDTPGALQAISAATGRGLTVGAGTVIDADGVRASADAGATFVVSPGLVDHVVETALAVGVDPVPGIATATELLRGQALGARIFKVFPAMSLGGPAFINALRSPFPDVRLVAVGGVEIADIGAYLDAGATAVALGRGLVGA